MLKLLDGTAESLLGEEQIVACVEAARDFLKNNRFSTCYTEIQDIMGKLLNKRIRRGDEDDQEEDGKGKEVEESEEKSDSLKLSEKKGTLTLKINEGG